MIVDGVGAMLDDLESFYKDVHRHPELSMQEERTAALAAERLQSAGFEVTTGVGRPVSWVCSTTATGRR
jgi:hippurate hydrolase